jgi:hypothetical protein
MRLVDMEIAILELLSDKSAAHAAWLDRPPGEPEEQNEPYWRAYLDARTAYERALEQWFDASRDEVRRLNEVIERMVA